MPGLGEKALWRAVNEFNRAEWTPYRLTFMRRVAGRFYEEDELWTAHGHSFLDNPRFQSAYARAMQASGWDYRIRWRAHTLLWAAEAASRVNGAFVECGTGRGFMASAVCDYLDWDDRPFYLFDTFSAKVPDSTGGQGQEQPDSPYYADGPEEVARNFAGWPGVRLVVGRIPDTLTDIGPVAFLHIDLNHAPSEEKALRHFWPHVTRGGFVVFDDYGFERFDGAEPAGPTADRLAEELGFHIYSSPTGQGIVVK